MPSDNKNNLWQGDNSFTKPVKAPNITALENRVAELEAKLAPKVAAPAPAPVKHVEPVKGHKK